MIEKLKKSILSRTAKPNLIKYIRFNMFGFICFLIASSVYALLGAGGWIAWIVAGFAGGLCEFMVQNRWVYNNNKLFGRLNHRLAFIDKLLLLDERN